jgi:hypothetical protein
MNIGRHVEASGPESWAAEESSGRWMVGEDMYASSPLPRGW